jgi:ribosomal protein S18 acetylase RimI-like enzyme
MVTVEPVDTKRKLKMFFDLPETLYGDDPNYVFPLRSELKKQFDRGKNPFFEHAEVQEFLAFRGREPVGRITAAQNFRHNEFYDDDAGFFGFFECADDKEIAGSLIKAAQEWLLERNLKTVLGPLSFSMNDDVCPGVLIEGFDTPPFILMGHARPYYRNLLESAGYEKAVDVLAFRMPVQQEINPRFIDLVQRIKRTRNINVRSFDPRNFWRDAKILIDIYNSAWEGNWGFVPFTEEEFYEIVKSLKKIYIKELVQIAEVDGEPAGWAMTLPNINEALIHLNGKLLPFGIFKFLYWMKRVKGLRLWGLGIKPEYRKRGVDVMLYYHTMLEGKRLGYATGELSWVLETNTPIIRAASYVKGELYKRYRVFKKRL